MNDSQPQARFDALTGSLTSRLLHGAGRASALYYKQDPQVPLRSLLHGITADGDFMIAYYAAEDDPARTMPTVCPIQVEIVREAMSPLVKLVTASAHILGDLEWVSLADAKEMAEGGQLPDHIADWAKDAPMRIGLISIEKLILHDPSGVSKICPQSLLAREPVRAFPSPSQEIDCSQMLGASNDMLRNVCLAVESGELPGKICGRCPQSLICGHIANKVVCADIDRLGVTLTHIRNDEITTVFAAFENPVSSIKEFEDEFEKICFAKGI